MSFAWARDYPKAFGTLVLLWYFVAVAVITKLLFDVSGDTMRLAVVLLQCMGALAGTAFVWTGATRFADPSKKVRATNYKASQVITEGPAMSISTATGASRRKIPRSKAILFGLAGVAVYTVFAAISALLAFAGK